MTWAHFTQKERTFSFYVCVRTLTLFLFFVCISLIRDNPFGSGSFFGAVINCGGITLHILVCAGRRDGPRSLQRFTGISRGLGWTVDRRIWVLGRGVRPSAMAAAGISKRVTGQNCSRG